MYQSDDPGRLGRNWNTKPIPQPAQSTRSEPEPYRSVMEEQLASLESRIEFMSNALTTIEHRLAPVMRETPNKVSEASLPCADSPLGRKLENFNSRMNGLQNHILYIVERLEI